MISPHAGRSVKISTARKSRRIVLSDEDEDDEQVATVVDINARSSQRKKLLLSDDIQNMKNNEENNENSWKELGSDSDDYVSTIVHKAKGFAVPTPAASAISDRLAIMHCTRSSSRRKSHTQTLQREAERELRVKSSQGLEAALTSEDEAIVIKREKTLIRPLHGNSCRHKSGDDVGRRLGFFKDVIQVYISTAALSSQ
jgi:hypothetical protein